VKVVLLDRDGTVIVEPSDKRVDSLEKIVLFPDTIVALSYLAENEFKVIFITNQAGIAEGRLTEAAFWRIHDEVLKRLQPSGVQVLKTYLNGEAADSTASQWRKPGPNMLLKAAKDYDLNLRDVYMVGDSQSDIQAANNAGCKGGILVKTKGQTTEPSSAVYTAVDLLDAVCFVVSHS
jgi:histidinol-phosphate phosphatase family protein